MPRVQARNSWSSAVIRRMISLKWMGLTLVLAFASAPSTLLAAPQSSPDLAQQIFDTMLQVHGVAAHYRPVHAKGIVCQGTFEATPAARNLSSAAHLQGKTVPITVRFSDGNPSPSIADGSPDAFPRGIAIRFTLPNGERTDIVAISHNGFIVATGEEFLALQKSIVATDPSKPHPWPVEQFIGSHPAALKFVQGPNPTPESFATESFFGNNAFLFINQKGAKQAFRYQILPVAGSHSLSDADAKSKPANFLDDDLRARLAKSPVKFRIVAQLAAAGDPTKDSTIVWPDDRKSVDLGTITITSLVPDNDAAQNDLAFDPTLLTDGIELSDDPLPQLRSDVYALSAMYRQAK